MTRIYFDSNVFTNLKNNSIKKFQLLNSQIQKYNDNLSFFFSHAHVRDKKKDSTDFKFEDFDFIESITGDNYLSYHALKHNTSFYLATPKMAFDDEDKEPDEYSFLKSFWANNKSDAPYITALKKVISSIFSDLAIPFDIKSFEKLSELDKKAVHRIISVDKEQLNITDLMQSILELQYKMLADNETYKEIRGMIDRNINAGKFVSKDGEIDFDEAFRNSTFKQSYADFVKSTLTPNNDGQIYYYDFYLQCYAV